jgi:hypothetical protein
LGQAWGCGRIQVTLVGFNFAHPDGESGVMGGESAQEFGLHVTHCFDDLLFELRQALLEPLLKSL